MPIHERDADAQPRALFPREHRGRIPESQPVRSVLHGRVRVGVLGPWISCLEVFGPGAGSSAQEDRRLVRGGAQVRHDVGVVGGGPRDSSTALGLPGADFALVKDQNLCRGIAQS